MRSIELMATKVIPELEKRGHRVSATSVVVDGEPAGAGR